MSMVEHVYEDDDLLVVNKPAGLLVHPDGRLQEPTLCDWFVGQYPQAKGVGEPIELSDGAVIERPGVVHRLDRETSGVLVLAKTQEAHAHLKAQFQNRDVQKEYAAFAWGEMKQEEGEIDRPIGRSKNDFRKWTAQRGTKGMLRPAFTRYSVLGRSAGFSYVSLEPTTGRTHQLRVHLKAVNYPIVCDKLYAQKQGCALGFERLALHAQKLTFMNLAGEQVSAEAPLPRDFSHALGELGLG